MEVALLFVGQDITCVYLIFYYRFVDLLDLLLDFRYLLLELQTFEEDFAFEGT
jgi:hypothetical protein